MDQSIYERPNYERSADELDIASQTQERMNDAGRAAVAHALRPQTAAGMTLTQCLECEEPLPPVRIDMKRTHCAPCQTEIDRLKKLGR